MLETRAIYRCYRRRVQEDGETLESNCMYVLVCISGAVW